MEKKNINAKISFTGLGIIFGSALGTGITLAIGQPIYWAGIGTGVGLIIGAAIDALKKRDNKEE